MKLETMEYKTEYGRSVPYNSHIERVDGGRGSAMSSKAGEAGGEDHHKSDDLTIMPKYLDEDLPDKKMMPVKLLASQMPEKLDRPPAEAFYWPIKSLYKEEQHKRQK